GGTSAARRYRPVHEPGRSRRQDALAGNSSHSVRVRHKKTEMFMGMTIGIDIGGTFTDVVALDGGGKIAGFTKVPSTPRDPGLAVVSGIEKILQISGGKIDDLDR